MRIRVIGVGSEQGDDAAGLAVAHRLAAGSLPPDVEVVACHRPGLDLLEEFSGADAVVLVDATRSGQPAGKVHRIPVNALQPRRGFSSHNLGVAEALALATALGRLPPHIEIVGIEGDNEAYGALSPAVTQGIDTAAVEVLTLIGELRNSATVTLTSNE